MALPSYERECASVLRGRIHEPRGKIQILTGPRQTGKSTAIRQVLRDVEYPTHYVEVPADAATGDWIRAQWQQARYLTEGGSATALLVIDEIQSVPQWASYVRELWDQDTMSDVDLRVVLSGSSALLLARGLAEGLTGRFEVIRSPQWSFAECREAFGYSLDEYLRFGGYPGAAPLIGEPGRWLDYMDAAVIRPSITRDVVALEPVRKPVLMERLFRLGTSCSGQTISYRKLLGQLDDAGNATTIAHYLDLLSEAGLLGGLQRYAHDLVRRRASSPKLISFDTGLITCVWQSAMGIAPLEADRVGRVVESAVGAELLRRSRAEHFGISWWREGNLEVDFVLEKGGQMLAIEVKSGAVKGIGGLEAFLNAHPGARGLVVGPRGAGWEGRTFAELGSFLAGDVALFQGMP